ncbi:MAG: alpha/beta hydrolase [Microgenomates group bacterium]
MQIPRETLIPTANEFRVNFKEQTRSHFFKYEVQLPLNPSETVINELRQSNAAFPMDRVKLTMWSETELPAIQTAEQLGELIQEKNPSSHFPVMLLGGLLSNPSQFDRTGTSFIRKLTDMIRSDGKHAAFHPLYIGMSGLGFTGSEINAISDYGKLDVGVRRYQTVLQTVLDELHFPTSRGALIGHSAGGAVVLEHEHKTTNDMLAKVALCPAIHLENARQFDLINKLVRLQENTIYSVKPLRKWSSEKVVRYLLGIPFATPFEKLPLAVQEQIRMHAAELDAHRYATHMKLGELNKPLNRGSKTVLSTLSVVAEKDRLTPPSQIKVGFPDDFNGFLTLPKAHHDDVFMREETQTLILPYIASYLMTKQVDYRKARAQKLM